MTTKAQIGRSAERPTGSQRLPLGLRVGFWICTVIAVAEDRAETVSARREKEGAPEDAPICLTRLHL